MKKTAGTVVVLISIITVCAVMGCGKSDETYDRSAYMEKGSKDTDSIPEGVTPEGIWLNYAERNGKPNAWIKIYRQGNEYRGRIIKLLQHPPGKPNPVCENCTGKYKNQRILGSEIIWGIEKTGENRYENGQILDVNNGKIYDCKMKLIEGGEKLKMRGFLKLEAAGRSKIWDRVQ